MSNLIEKIFDSLEIRDLNQHISPIIYSGEFLIKTIIIENNLNRVVTLQIEGCATKDFSHPFLVGSSFNVSNNTASFETSESYIPYWRMKASCLLAPTSGDLTVYIMGVN